MICFLDVSLHLNVKMCVCVCARVRAYVRVPACVRVYVCVCVCVHFDIKYKRCRKKLSCTTEKEQRPFQVLEAADMNVFVLVPPSERSVSPTRSHRAQ
jgi:hypothetical protein